jgi:uncharacterized protein YggE
MNNLPKGIVMAIAGLVIAFLGLAVIDKAHTISKSFNTRPDNTIAMTAEGKVSAAPDLATITVGVLSNADSAKAAQQDATTKTNQIVDYVKKQGVKSEDITTSNFSVYPNYNYANGKNEISGYQANQTVTVKIHDVDKSTEVVDKVLDGAVANGGNQVQGVYFSFNDPDNLKQEARKQAIEKAKQKAQELASQTGLKVGKIVGISDDSTSMPTPMPYGLGMGGGAADAKSMPAVQTGSQDVTANVTVTFEIK